MVEIIVTIEECSEDEVEVTAAFDASLTDSTDTEIEAANVLCDELNDVITQLNVEDAKQLTLTICKNIGKTT
jgi:hypothetical protein